MNDSAKSYEYAPISVGDTLYGLSCIDRSNVVKQTNFSTKNIFIYEFKVESVTKAKGSRYHVKGTVKHRLCDFNIGNSVIEFYDDQCFFDFESLKTYLKYMVIPYLSKKNYTEWNNSRCDYIHQKYLSNNENTNLEELEQIVELYQFLTLESLNYMPKLLRSHISSELHFKRTEERLKIILDSKV